MKKFNKALKLPPRSRESYNLLLEVVKAEPEFAEALYILADINKTKALRSVQSPQNRKKYENRAKDYYEKVIEVCPSFDRYYSYYYIGKYYYVSNQFEKAIKYFGIFLKNNNSDKKEISEAGKIQKEMTAYLDLISNPVPFEPKRIEGVSTNSDEFLPLISPDGDFIFFTHRFLETDKYTTIQKQVEYFSISQKRKDSTGNESFTEGRTMPIPFNQGARQGAAAITIDNNHIFMTICQFTDITGQAYENCDIYSSDYENGEWTDFRNLGPNVNHENTWESQPSISSDGKTLFFASIREDNIGFKPGNYTSDIYLSRLDDDGNWQAAQNLGSTINTGGNEKSPFLHSDSKTLYFASDGRIGVGGYDIYYSKQLNGNSWLEPVNIGYPINTQDDDLGFIVSTDGRKAYFSSNKLNGGGGWDIYSFDLYEKARPEKVLFIKGYLIDEDGNKITDAKIEMRSAFTQRVAEGMVDKMTGKYAVAVSYEPDEEFIMTVKKKDYAFTSRYFSPSDDMEYEIYDELEIEIRPIEVGVTIKLHNILFDTNSDEFDDGSRVVLNRFIEFLKDNESVKIDIHGHTDNIGAPAMNLDLSNRRAKAIERYLVSKEISHTRMRSKGFGESRPVASNSTEEGRALNRRTEFVITEK
ncbi:MAG: OmpA family protein [Bacteroidota bacterium]|nr:OmpA family protein [Bacteroidota bacterium]